MIRKLLPIMYKKVKRISPSQFYSALQCPYKMVLAEAYCYKPLIALSPNTYLGSVLHYLIELITKKVIIDLPTFEQYWTDAIQKKEMELKMEGLHNLTPLKNHVKDFGLKKEYLLQMIMTRSIGSNPRGGNSRYKSEMPLFDDTGKVYGKADLVYAGDDHIDIYDFKTGNITQEALNENGETVQLIKEEYEYQLKLYAYLYFLRTGKNPDNLYLVALDKKKVNIPFTPENGEKIYKKALDLLDKLDNGLVSETLESQACCSVSNCTFCMYRPACKHYKRWMNGQQDVTNDISGVLSAFKVFPNGNACAYIMDGGNNRIVSGFNQKDEASFNLNINKCLVFYNVKKDKNSINLTATKFTTIYEC